MLLIQSSIVNSKSTRREAQYREDIYSYKQEVVDVLGEQLLQIMIGIKIKTFYIQNKNNDMDWRIEYSTRHCARRGHSS